MIDLHIHTIHSDGEDSVENILKQAESLNLEVISITDHPSVICRRCGYGEVFEYYAGLSKHSWAAV